VIYHLLLPTASLSQIHQKFIHLSLFNIILDNIRDVSHNMSAIDFASSPPADESLLHELGLQLYDFDQDMSLTEDYFMAGSSTAPDDSLNFVPSTPQPGASESRYWKPSLNAPPGREGETPYLNLNDFESAEDLLDPSNDQIDSATLFNSLQEAVHWQSQQVVEDKPEYDKTIPRSLHAKKACVKLLFKAWKSTGSATDNPRMKEPFEEERHDNARVECVCWRVLEALICRSEQGPLLVAYDPTKAKYNPTIGSFAVRFDEVVTSLREQKTICKHLLDSPYINTFVDDPVYARNRVASNRDLNNKKGNTMSLGKNHKEAESGTSRTKGTKRQRPASVDGEFSDEQTPMYLHSTATIYGTPGHSARKTGTGSSSQHVSTPMRSGYGSSGLYMGSPVGLQMNARGSLISYPSSPTLGPSLELHNIQSPSGQSLVQPPSFTPQGLPQSVFGNYNTIVGQTQPSAYMFPTPNMSHAILPGIDGQVSAF
jgi:hypothetical protein